MQFGEMQCLFDLDTALLSETQMAKGLQLFVNRLSFYTTSEQLKKIFSPFGVVTEARLVKDPRTQRPKGFGFVTFESEADAQNALNSLNGRKASFTFGGKFVSQLYKVHLFSFPPGAISYIDCPSFVDVYFCSVIEMIYRLQIVDGRLIFVEVAETTEAVENKTSQK
ncbi:hypothetical protein MTR67_049837 [Solanum verrucosum]|uniref:RRM domain-containing protein n=1 Tax=Solanum verrucosum TaxID=315347 RepID=A0AAF0V170_SOLVR|nr:hypothetical protein MTR67_049837 [Solanum verrucosum]